MSTLLTNLGLVTADRIGSGHAFQLWLSPKYFRPDTPYLVIGGHNGEKYYLPLFESDVIKNSYDFRNSVYLFLKKNGKIFRLVGQKQNLIEGNYLFFLDNDAINITGVLTASYEEDYYECGETVGHYNVRASLTFTASTKNISRYGLTYGIHVRSMKAYSNDYNSAKRFDDFVLCNDKVTSESLKGTPYYKPYTKTITFDTQISEAAFENENDRGNCLTRIEIKLDEDIHSSSSFSAFFINVAKNQTVTNIRESGSLNLF